MSDVTAIVLSAGPYARRWPGCSLLVSQQVIRTPHQLQAARFFAIQRVGTPYFFFLDDDDELPADIERVLGLALALRAPLVYTDEVAVIDGVDHRTQRQPYSQAAHLADATLVHHLALCRTFEAKRAIADVPRGAYAPEPLLYWQLAKQGAVYLPEVGYRWHCRPGGLHADPQMVMSWTRARLWCKEHP